jgi:acyl-CoA synthetase (AMP-forming)/AMP-acid ligase II
MFQYWVGVKVRGYGADTFREPTRVDADIFGNTGRVFADKLAFPEEAAVRENLIVSTPNAYTYPLLVKQLLTNSLSLYGDQEITYRGEVRYTYRDFRRRVGQLASALEGLGVRHGTTVAVMDWDSHRYLESYFAIPMMGATLFTVNVRLAPHQIAYALNDSEAEIVLVHADFVPMLEAIKDELTGVRGVVVLADGQALPATTWAVAGEYEELVGQASPDFEFGDFDENTKAATFYTSGTTGDPKGVYYSHRQIVLHTMATAMTLCAPRAGQRIHRSPLHGRLLAAVILAQRRLEYLAGGVAGQFGHVFDPGWALEVSQALTGVAEGYRQQPATDRQTAPLPLPGRNSHLVNTHRYQLSIASCIAVQGN